MLFNSLQFLVYFAIVTVGYFAMPHKFRWLWLLLASCYFYMAFIPVYILILGLTIVIDYFAGIIIEQANNKGAKHSRLFLTVSIVVNIGILALFKYYNFFTENINGLLAHYNQQAIPYLDIILPIGLSFHTFQAMSYTIEVYRGNQKAEKHFGIYALYVMFYPQLVAGPIERPQNMLHQFHEKKSFQYKAVTDGLKLMTWGLFKKVVIADRLALITDPVFDHPHNFPAITLALAAFFFSFQIFCDFSGYSDIALGAAQVMGFKLMTNFNRPYHSQSIAEFWKRWHISLSTWFRDYLYIALGGNRVAVPRWYFNLFFVFLVSGLWHGANWTFIVWGALHGVYLILALLRDRYFKKVEPKGTDVKKAAIQSYLSILSTFTIVTLTWIFFRALNVKDAIYIIKNIPSGIAGVFQHQSLQLESVTSFQVFLAFFFILFMETIHIAQHYTGLRQWLNTKHYAFRWAIYYGSVILIIVAGVFQNKQFIYFQF